MVKISQLDRPLLGVSILALAVYLFYTFSFVWATPYPGIVFTATSEGWQVNDSTQPSIEVDEILVQIGDLTYQEYTVNNFVVPFSGYDVNGTISNIVTDDGKILEIKLTPPSAEDRLRRLISTLWFFPFWLAGTAVLLFLRPRDLRWRLIIAFMFLAAIWAVVGSIANWKTGASYIVSNIIAWLMVPIVIHLHLTVPSPIFERATKRVMPFFYVTVILFAALESIQFSPHLNLSVLALAGAVLISIGILLFRSLRKSAALSDRNSARLMLAGIGLAFGPGILIVLLPQLLGISVSGTFGLSVAILSLPIFPISYTYAIYKRQLGQLEFRANRLLGLYSFILIYPTIFIIVLLFGEQWIGSSSSRTFYLLFVSIVFVLATPPMLNWLQNTINRLAYGTVHNPDDILRVFAKQIPFALTRDALSLPLTKDILPAMLIRQSALFLFNNDSLELIYSDKMPQSEKLKTPQDLSYFLQHPGIYISPDSETVQENRWIRLPIPLVTREETIGVWLLGRRDPDDFYPQNDIDLLQTLANQMAPVIENIRLYEALQQHADRLAEEVAERTSELRAEKDRAQAVLDSAGEGIFFTDPDGVILYANPAMAHQSGYSSDELQGKNLELWQVEEDAVGAYREMWTAIYTGNEWGGEMMLACKDGIFRDVSLVIAPIPSEDGKLTGFVGVQSDISKLKEVDRVKSNIISSVSHELKTPLTTIKTYLMLIQRGKPEKRENYLAILNRESDRLATIIEDLLDLSSLEAGKIPSTLAPVNLSNIIEDVVFSCQPQALQKQMQVLLDLDPDLPLALADSHQMEQVLTNLLINALNYTQEQGQIILTTEQRLISGKSLVGFKVADNGPGISVTDMPHLFDRFYRGDAALASGAPGTGLGLAICKEIIDRHNGKIEVESQLGQGTTFSVWLSVAAQNIKGKAPQILPSTSEEIIPSD